MDTSENKSIYLVSICDIAPATAEEPKSTPVSAAPYTGGGNLNKMASRRIRAESLTEI